MTYSEDRWQLEGVHYIRPFGGRKILYLWEVIAKDIMQFSSNNSEDIPMANGGNCNG